MIRLLSLILLITMSLGTVVNAQEITGTGYGNVPIEYSQSSTFTVVLPDSIVLDSTKTGEFEIYLSDYDLIEGESVKIKPLTNTVIMENVIKPIEYLVGYSAYSYDGLPVFPTYRYYESSTENYFIVYEHYVLTKDANNNFYLYCEPKVNTRNSTAPIVTVNRYMSGDVEHYKIQSSSCVGTKYNDKNGTSIKSNGATEFGDLELYKYDFNTNSWVNQENYSATIPETETIIQSTCEIVESENINNKFVQYPKEEKEPIEITITMENQFLTDSTPVKCIVDGSNLSSGDWNGEVVFEITLE